MRKLFTFLMVALFSASVWADGNLYQIKGEGVNGWDADWTDMEQSEDTYYEYYQISDGSSKTLVKIIATSTEIGLSNKMAGFNGTDVTNTWIEGDKNVCFYDASAYYILVYKPNTVVNPGSDPIICASSTKPNTTGVQTVYFVNVPGWSTPLAHAFENTKSYKPWANDDAMTSTGTQVNQYDVYSYTFPNNFGSVIFRGGSDQTADLTCDAATPYYYNGTWYASVEAIPASPIMLHGTFTDGTTWADTEEFEAAVNKETATLTLENLEAGSYEFGVFKDGAWISNGLAFTRASASHMIVAGSGNCTLNVDKAGNYTFTWTYATNTLTVTYPAHTYTLAWSLGAGANEELGEMEIVRDLEDKPTDSYTKYFDKDILTVGTYNVKLFEDGVETVITTTLEISAVAKYALQFDYDSAKGELTATATNPRTPTSVDNTEVEGKAAKVIRDGQLLIVKDGKTFNVLGTVVR